jgi:prephenate decarboxylase
MQDSICLSIATGGTLGPKGSSSEEALSFASKHFFEQPLVKITLYDTFEVLKESLLNNEVQVAVVPHAYDKINHFYMDPCIRMIDIFKYPTPVYGLAKKKGVEVSIEQAKIVTHPAPLPLLPRLLPQHNCDALNISLVSSTSAAALMVKTDLACLAITNGNAVKEYGLEFVSIYGPIAMSWTIFERRS